FPEVKIILGHLGTQGELSTIEALLVADRHPNVYLETSWAMPHMLIEAVHEVGAGRLLFGSNTPPLEQGQQIMNVEEALAFEPPIGMAAAEADIRQVLGGNLARLLGL
ncbi:MAG: amidohydrolase family protein, partial [Anaerolineae bacterium]